MTSPVNILVVHKADVPELENVQGVCADPTVIADIVDNLYGRAQYMPRPEMEKDPSFFQFIPYGIFLTVNQGELQVLAYGRNSGGGEVRLAERSSIGLGGHVDAEPEVRFPEGSDLVIVSQVRLSRAMAREILEETNLGEDIEGLRVVRQGIQSALAEEPTVLNTNGLMIDRSNEVGELHLALLYFFLIQPEEAALLKVSEVGLSNHGFLNFEQLRALNLETWSSLALDYIEAQAPGIIAEHHRMLDYANSVTENLPLGVEGLAPGDNMYPETEAAEDIEGHVKDECIEPTCTECEEEPGAEDKPN